jgi:hypothetical protein
MASPGLTASIARGVAAGVLGTATMTAVQLAVRVLRGQPLGTQVPRTWAEAPAPAQVVKRAADALGKGRKITKQQVPLVTNAMHWAYGTGWGAAYGVAAHLARPGRVTGGLGLAAGLWGASYAQLVPLGIYKAPWEYPPGELGLDVGYHLAYGLAVATAFDALGG